MTYLDGIIQSHRKTGKAFFFFLITRDVQCVHHGWHGTHWYDIEVVATHASTCWRVCGNNLNIPHPNPPPKTHTNFYVFWYSTIRIPRTKGTVRGQKFSAVIYETSQSQWNGTSVAIIQIAGKCVL